MFSTHICEITGQQFYISDAERDFCDRMGVPLPTKCPDERIRELTAARNERRLHRRICDATHKEIISAYPSNTPFPVYKNSIWWGDSWDGEVYGRDFDFSRPFFEQFAELQKVVPREGTSIFNSENCDYNSHTRQSKNCYLNSLVVESEDAYYCYWVTYNKNIIDCTYTYHSELCYECLDIDQCYNVISLQESANSTECFFSYQLRGCSHCIFCTNLVSKEYYAWNKPCTPEEFLRIKNEVLNGSYSAWQKAQQEFYELRQKTIHRALHNNNSENVIGDHLIHSRNLLNCFDGQENEDCTNVVSLGASKNIHSCYSIGWPSSEDIYSSSVVRGSTNVAFSMHIFLCHNMTYADSCHASHDLFGCIGMHHKQYAILNKCYEKEEYEDLRQKIIAHMQQTGEWGKFFPPQLLPFAYNETAAQDYHPLLPNEAQERGYAWYEEEEKAYKSATAILPDNVSETPDSICTEVMSCVKSGKNYKIIPQELEFYRRMNLPLPRLCPEERHLQRMSFRNPRTIWQRPCMKCSREMYTTYAPDRSEIIYCEECYLEEMY